MTDATTLPDLPCYLNGEFTTLREAKVSVMDRGFIFGDGIYEVVPIYGGKPFRFNEHMARLERSLAELRIPNPNTLAQWRELVVKLASNYAQFAKVPLAECDQMAYIQITRGVAMRDHAMIPGLTPTVFAMANRMSQLPAAERAKGVSCVTADDFRWKKAHIKSTSLAGAVISRQISVDAEAVETIMFRDGMLSEASSSNVWVVKDGKVSGVPRDNLVLEGIRFGLMEQLCREAGISCELRRIPREEVLAADELLLSSATKEILPVTTLDGKPVANGRPGPIYEKLYAGYQQAKQAS
ncbi:D-amino acid aminotransferase [Ramlibacter humi]|uniref:D-amino acid aminotransferase n=1 Tax=Ramlibacter humi TaxID=2530451 RepID=A0A4Z0BKG1_9BURK|nr:D-amino acid aminotransferase [Ramlibacter humi]TFY98388.1 D-amino acid aminotransferase [Ramlibacter humi]